MNRVGSLDRNDEHKFFDVLVGIFRLKEIVTMIDALVPKYGTLLNQGCKKERYLELDGHMVDKWVSLVNKSIIYSIKLKDL